MSRILLSIVLLVATAGCTGGAHRWSLRDFQSFVVPVKSKPGTYRLRTEANYDATIRLYLKTHGIPDYIYVVDRRTVKLIFEKKDIVVTFRRPLGSQDSLPSVLRGIPDDLRKKMVD